MSSLVKIVQEIVLKMTIVEKDRRVWLIMRVGVGVGEIRVYVLGLKGDGWIL